MAVKYCTFVFFSVVGGLSGDPPVPKYSNSYNVSGTIRLPYAEIVEPFVAFFDGENGRSRVDYYGGEMTKHCLLFVLTRG